MWDNISNIYKHKLIKSVQHNKTYNLYLNIILHLLDFIRLGNNYIDTYIYSYALESLSLCNIIFVIYIKFII